MAFFQNCAGDALLLPLSRARERGLGGEGLRTKTWPFPRAVPATQSSPSFPHRATIVRKPDPRSRMFVGVLREEGARGRMRANRTPNGDTL